MARWTMAVSERGSAEDKRGRTKMKRKRERRKGG